MGESNMSEAANEQRNGVTGEALRAKARPWITNPETGNSYRVRKPTIATLIKSGVLPENYVGQMLDEAAKSGDIEPAEERERPLTDKEILESETVKQVIVTPVLTAGGERPLGAEPD